MTEPSGRRQVQPTLTSAPSRPRRRRSTSPSSQRCGPWLRLPSSRSWKCRALAAWSRWCSTRPPLTTKHGVAYAHRQAPPETLDRRHRRPTGHRPQPAGRPPSGTVSHPRGRPSRGRSSTDCAAPLLAGGARWQAPATAPSTHLKGIAVPPTDRGLLARLDALVELAADRHGLALLPGGRLAAAEARVAARVAGLTPTARGASTARGPRPPGGRRPPGRRWPNATRWSCYGPWA